MKKFLMMILSLVSMETSAAYLCEGKIKTQFVNITISNITPDSIEMGLQNGSIILENETMFPMGGMFIYSASLDDQGSFVKIALNKNRMDRVKYSYKNGKDSGNGWLKCRQ